MISVIVPVYNTEAYLDRCVESILAQTYSDFELILVDDGSKDRSPQMCDEWSNKDARIKVIHKENGGAATARNRGIEAAVGDFIVFVDSDDWIEPTMFEILWEALNKNNADIVECRLEWLKKVEDAYHYDGSEYKSICFDNQTALEELIRERRLHQTPVNKLYRKEVLKGISFKEGSICEDEYWTYQVFGNAKRIMYLDLVLYHYWQSEGSVMRKPYSLKRLACIDAYQERLAYVSEHFPALYGLANKSYMSSCLFHYQMLCRYPDVDVDWQARAGLHARFLAGDFASLLAVANCKYKIWYRLFRHFPSFTSRLRNLFGIGL